jgi:hypothetical protein
VEVVTAAARLPRSRRQDDGLTQPFPRWRVALIGVLGIVVSAAGWVSVAQLDRAQASATGADAQRDALVRLVSDRCRAGLVADVAVCRAAQSAARPARR